MMNRTDEQYKAFDERVNSDPRFKEIEKRLRAALIDHDKAALNSANEDMRRLLAELNGH